MKHALLTTLAILGLTAFAPRAEAGRYVNVLAGYDRCGHPVYTRTYRPDPPCAPRHRTYYTPRHRYSDDYRRPTYVRDSCHSSSRSRYSTPRLSFHLGF